MKLKHGIVYSSSSGNLGGAIVQSGSHGSTLYMRTRKTRRIAAIDCKHRRIFDFLSKKWRKLSKYRVAQWNTAALSFKRNNFFESVRPLTGFQLFVRFNFYRILSTGVFYDSFAFYATKEICSIVRFVSVASSNTLTVYKSITLDTNIRVCIFATSQRKNSVVPSTGSFKYITSVSGHASSPQSLVAAYRAVYPDSLVSGYFLFFKTVMFTPLGLPYYPAYHFSCKIT